MPNFRRRLASSLLPKPQSDAAAPQPAPVRNTCGPVARGHCSPVSVHGQPNGAREADTRAMQPEQALQLGFINLLYRPATCKASAATFLPRCLNQPLRVSERSQLVSESVTLDPSAGLSRRSNAANGRRHELLSRILCGTQLTAQQGPVTLVGLASDNGMMCRTTGQAGDDFPRRSAAVHPLTLRPISATATTYA